jgi:hypothetical protein
MTVDIAFEEKNKRFLFNWIPSVYYSPRKVFQRISISSSSLWLTPLIVITCLVLINVLVVGRFKSQAASMGEITYPPDFQYYTPEQQAQYMQAAQSTQGPVFMYVLPAIISLLGVWFGWLIMGGMLHLVMTLFGGRGNTITSMNIVAWASLPLALRTIVQIAYVLASHRLINSPGLSGFSPSGDSNWILFFSQFLKLVDIYIIWQVLLIILGVRLSTGLSSSKSSLGVILTVVIILLLQASLSYFGNVLGNLSITRPFFF